MAVISIKLYKECDVYIRQNSVEWLGFDKHKTFGEMVDLAILHKCHIITKNGGGKWYLKGQDKDYISSMNKIENAAGKYPRIKCWILEFGEEQIDIEDEDTV
jgi:hypothetical protein